MSSKVVEISTEEQLKKEFQEAVHILHNLRFYTKYWNEHGGFKARENMNRWQARADNYLNGHGCTLHNNINSVTVLKG